MLSLLKYAYRYSQRLKFICYAFILLLIAFATASCFGIGDNTTQTTPIPNTQIVPQPSGVGYFPSGAIHVQGNQLVDPTGHSLVLRGSQIEGAFNVQNQGTSELLATQNLNNTTFNVMHQQWNMNVVRIPLCDYLWQSDPEGYIAHLDTVIQEAINAKLVVVLDLHEDTKCGAPLDQLSSKLPFPLSVSFWKAIATHFKDNPYVMFDVYNEPAIVRHHGNALKQTDADWKLWLHGGLINGQQYIGMQELVDTIRATGANQIIMVEGLSIGTSFNNIGNNTINDPNIVYEVHMYFGSKRLTSSDWDRDFGFLTSRYPVYVGEWAFLPYKGSGAGDCSIPPNQAVQKVNEFLNYMAAHNVSWSAWSFMQNRLLASYTNYTPTNLDGNWTCGPTSHAGIGQIVKDYLTGHQ